MVDTEEQMFQQQFVQRLQNQVEELEDEAERAWQAQVYAQQGNGNFGSHLLNPKGKSASTAGMPPSLANVFQPPEPTYEMTPEEAEEEAERAWREALALQGGDGMEEDDAEAERAWKEALEAQQEALDLQDDEYYEELYRNTRINEGNKVSLEKEIQELNEQRWKLRDKKSEYYSGMKELMESSKALDILKCGTREGKPLRGILKKRLERVQIDRRLTLRMIRSPAAMPQKKLKRVGFILPEEVDQMELEELERKKVQQYEKLLSNAQPEEDEQEFREMAAQFMQDFKEEEERLKAESEEIKRMEEQVARLEAELAREGIALAQKAGAVAVPAVVEPNGVADPLAEAKNAALPARIKRGTKGFGGVFIDEVHKMLGQEELEKINARIASIPQEDAEDEAAEGKDEEDEDKTMEQAADSSLPTRIKRGTKGFGGVFIDQVHKMLEEDKKLEEQQKANGGASPAKTPAASAKPGPTTPGSPKPAPVPPRPNIAKPGPTAGGQQPKGASTKPPPANMSKLQLDKLNKEEEERRAAEQAAKKEEEDRRNKERLKQAAEARKVLTSPRPASVPVSPKTPTTPTAKPGPTQAATNGSTRPTTTPSPKPSPDRPPRPTSGQQPTTPTSPAGPAGRGTPTNSSSTPPPSGLRRNPPPSPGASTPPSSAVQPPSPVRKAGSAIYSRPAGDPAAAQPNGRPTNTTTPAGGGRGAPTVGPPGSTPRAPPVKMGPSSGSERMAKVTAPTQAKPGPAAVSPRGKPGPAPVKPLNHPEPVKRGVARPTNVDPTISAKANFFEAKQQQNSGEDEEIIQRRARLDLFKNKILAKNNLPSTSPRVSN